MADARRLLLGLLLVLVGCVAITAAGNAQRIPLWLLCLATAAWGALVAWIYPPWRRDDG